MSTPANRPAPTRPPSRPAPPRAAGAAGPESIVVRLPPLARAALWCAVGALVLAAVVAAVWVLVGDTAGLFARAFLTVLAFAAFAALVLGEARVVTRPAWYLLLRIGGWLVALGVAMVKIWARLEDGVTALFGVPVDVELALFAQVALFLLAVGIVQLLTVHVVFLVRGYVTSAGALVSGIAAASITLVAALAILLLIPVTFSEWAYGELYWRAVVAVVILAALATALAPIVRILLRGRRADDPAPARAPRAAATPREPGAEEPEPEDAALDGDPDGSAPGRWPTYRGGDLPLPEMPDGRPDWDAYRSGRPSPGSRPHP